MNDFEKFEYDLTHQKCQYYWPRGDRRARRFRVALKLIALAKMARTYHLRYGFPRNEEGYALSKLLNELFGDYSEDNTHV